MESIRKDEPRVLVLKGNNAFFIGYFPILLNFMIPGICSFFVLEDS